MNIAPHTLRRGPGPRPADRWPLRAGPLRMLFEPDSGLLRYLRIGEHEVLRGIYAAVRDHNWDTIEPVLSPPRIERHDDRFALSFHARHRRGPIDFTWTGRIEGSPDGTVRYTFDGEARSTFRRNRIGFCILHPMQCAGLPCTVQTVDGAEHAGRFPDLISPHQPWRRMRAIRHEARSGLSVEVRMEGDTFEMEDQRNWTDASFKTYCTPLSDPFPVEVPAGMRIRQAVTVRPLGEAPPAAGATSAADSRIVLEPAHPPQAVPLPALGLAAGDAMNDLTATEHQRIRALNLAHLRVDLPADGADDAERLNRAAAMADHLALPLELAINLADGAEPRLETLARLLQRRPLPIARWLVFHAGHKCTPAPTVRLARGHLAPHSAGAPIGGGTQAYFTELNRDRPDPDSLDAICYSINPQVHAFDDASLIETLPAQAQTVRSARAFAGGRPVLVTPITLRPRFNPNATGPEPEPPPGEPPAQVDPRQMSLLAAAWTLGSIKYLAVGGAAAATYYETTGWRGVMETTTGSPLPKKFPSIPGCVFPLYHVLADAGEFRNATLRPLRSSDPLSIDGLWLEATGRTRLLIANFTDDSRQLTLPAVTGSWTMRLLDETTAAGAMTEPETFRAAPGRTLCAAPEGLSLELRPCAVVTLDGEAGRHG